MIRCCSVWTERSERIKMDIMTYPHLPVQCPHLPSNCPTDLTATKMVEATMAMSFSIPKAQMNNLHLHPTKMGNCSFSHSSLRMVGGSKPNSLWSKSSGESSRMQSWKVNALPDWFSAHGWPLMVVTVEHVAGQRDWVVHKSIWHLNDETIKNIYTMYIMFTCWGCCFFGSTKDPFYDSELYRKDGGDGTVHWIYDRQEELEEEARAELLREELIEEIELKVGGLRELEEAGK